MKKLTLSLLLLTALCLTLLCGCGGSGEEAADTQTPQETTQAEETPFFIGSWFAQTAQLNGGTVDAKEVFGGTFFLLFEKNGDCVMAIDSQQAMVAWTYNEDGTITLTGDDTYEIRFPDGSEDTMIAVIKGVEVTLEKHEE